MAGASGLWLLLCVYFVCGRRGVVVAVAERKQGLYNGVSTASPKPILSLSTGSQLSYDGSSTQSDP